MKFAMFYEIPVPKPWTPAIGVPGVQEHDRAGEARRPHGLPLVLDGRAPLPRRVLALLEPRGALRHTSRRVTENIRIGYGVRLLPEAVQPSGAHRRERRGARPRSATAASSSAPAARRRAPRSKASASTRTRHARCGTRRSITSSASGPTTSTSSRASTGRCRSGACTRSRCSSRTRRSGARRRAVEGHYEIGKRGIGLLSFTVGNPARAARGAHRRTTARAGRLQRAGRQVPQRAPPRRSRWCTAPTPTRRRAPSPKNRSSGTRRRRRSSIASLAE